MWMAIVLVLLLVAVVGLLLQFMSIAEREGKIRDLQAALDSRSSTIHQMRSDIDQQRESIRRLTEESASVARENADLLGKVTILQNDLEACEQSRQKWREDVEALEGIVRELKAEKERATSLIRELTVSLEQSRKETFNYLRQVTMLVVPASKRSGKEAKDHPWVRFFDGKQWNTLRLTHAGVKEGLRAAKDNEVDNPFILKGDSKE